MTKERLQELRTRNAKWGLSSEERVELLDEVERLQAALVFLVYRKDDCVYVGRPYWDSEGANEALAIASRAGVCELHVFQVFSVLPRGIHPKRE